MRVGMALVRGRSMLPTLADGDRLLVRYGARPKAGDVAVVRLPGGGLAVKRLDVEYADGWWASSDNPHEGVDSWTLWRAVDDVVGVAGWRLWPRPGRV
jgi:phage repressor protein C with HTH and peptisase S24 domain